MSKELNKIIEEDLQRDPYLINDLALKYCLDEYLIDKYSKFILKPTWNFLARGYILSTKLINKYFCKFPYIDHLIRYQDLSEDLIDNIIKNFKNKYYNNKLDEKKSSRSLPSSIVTYQNLSKNQLLNNLDIFDIYCIIKYQDLKEDIDIIDKLSKISDKLSNNLFSENLSTFQKFSEDFLEKYHNKYKFDWRMISRTQDISNSFIDKWNIPKDELSDNIKFLSKDTIIKNLRKNVYEEFECFDDYFIGFLDSNYLNIYSFENCIILKDYKIRLKLEKGKTYDLSDKINNLGYFGVGIPYRFKNRNKNSITVIIKVHYEDIKCLANDFLGIKKFTVVGILNKSFKLI